MQSFERIDIANTIKRHGKSYQRIVAWADLPTIHSRGCLQSGRPSGYTEWFVVQESSIWWVFYDASDSGSFGPSGIEVTGYAIRHREDIAQAIGALRGEESKRARRANAYGKARGK